MKNSILERAFIPIRNKHEKELKKQLTKFEKLIKPCLTKENLQVLATEAQVYWTKAIELTHSRQYADVFQAIIREGTDLYDVIKKLYKLEPNGGAVTDMVETELTNWIANDVGHPVMIVIKKSCDDKDRCAECEHNHECIFADDPKSHFFLQVHPAPPSLDDIKNRFMGSSDDSDHDGPDC